MNYLDDRPITESTWQRDLVRLRAKRAAAIIAGRPTRILDAAIAATEREIEKLQAGRQ